MENGGDILQLCRLCLVKDDVNISIFEEQGDIRQILQKISSCLPVKVSREDKLPKKICDGCSYKLDMFYEFWNSTANAEKQLLSWLGEIEMKSKLTDGAVASAVAAQQMKPAETVVKQEAIDPSDIHTEENDDDKSYTLFPQGFSAEEAGSSATAVSNEEPPPKRARRTAAVKAQIAMDPESDDDDDSGEPVTKVEDESEESEGDDRDPPFVDAPSTSADDQPGPSGVGKDGAEAPTVKLEPEDANLGKEAGGVTNQSLYISERPHRCNLCPKRFMSSTSLEQHRRNLHYDVVGGTPPVTYNCTTCNKMYKCPVSFKKHNIIVHNSAKEAEAVICEVCGKKLSSKRDYKFHCRLHTGYKPCICDLCGKSFTKKDTLSQHLRTHTGEKPYPCRYCGKGFSQLTPRKVHERIHTGERPYKCNICGKDFASKITLKTHGRTCYRT